MKRNVLVTTCGTSLLTNAAKDEVQRKMLREIANAAEGDLTDLQRKTVEALVGECRHKLTQGGLPAARRLSAELNGLMGFYNNQPAAGRGDTHYLLHTDTYLGVQAAEVLSGYLRDAGLQAELLLMIDLRTDTMAHFHAGLGEIIRWCQENLSVRQQGLVQVVFNLSGGFKSIQGWMQTLGMFYADEMIYIFEDQRELLRIPRVPVDISAAAEEQIRQNINLFRRLAPRGDTIPFATLPVEVAEVFFYRLDEEVELSPWGRLVWSQVKGKLYQEKLLEPPEPRIVYSERFLRAAENRSADELAMLNERLDDFAAYLRSNGQQNPRRLDVKKFRGAAPPPSTHEFDAWAKRPAWRVFFHDENGKNILDNLREGDH